MCRLTFHKLSSHKNTSHKLYFHTSIDPRLTSAKSDRYESAVQRALNDFSHTW